MASRVDAYLVTGGKYHDVDFARLEVLKLLADHPEIRVRVASDYEDVEAIAAAAFLVSYTCDVRPSQAAQDGIRDWVQAGGRWMALHGTNSALDLGRPTGVESPRCFPTWAHTLGSQFVAHPPIAPYKVETTDASHWLVEGIGEFETDDELYCSEYHDADALHPLLHTTWTGQARGFREVDWTSYDRHLVMYLRPLGQGAVLYNTLGHCRGHYDMTMVPADPPIAYYPKIERGSWAVPQYYELLRRSIRWAKGETA